MNCPQFTLALQKPVFILSEAWSFRPHILNVIKLQNGSRKNHRFPIGMLMWIVKLDKIKIDLSVWILHWCNSTQLAAFFSKLLLLKNILLRCESILHWTLLSKWTLFFWTCQGAPVFLIDVPYCAKYVFTKVTLYPFVCLKMNLVKKIVLEVP